MNVGEADMTDQVFAPEIPWQASQAIESWRRILNKSVNFQRASVELLRLADKGEQPDMRRVIVDSLYEMAQSAGIDDDTAQALMASGDKAPADTRLNGASLARAAKATYGSAFSEAPAPASPDEYGVASAETTPAAPRFTPVAIDDVEVNTGPAWLVRHLLPARGLACVVGSPKSGKSFLTTDMLFSVARGAAYAGRETLAGPVIYLTGEGVIGFKRRLVAMRQHYEVEGQGVPFFMIENVPDLGSEQTDVLDLIHDLNAFIAARGLDPPRAVVLDTLARCMGAGDENTARDMGRFVNRCGIIERHFQCAVVVVHHMGKNPGAGGRGSNALNGAADVTFTVEKGDAYSTVRIDEMKDGPEGPNFEPGRTGVLLTRLRAKLSPVTSSVSATRPPALNGGRRAGGAAFKHR